MDAAALEAIGGGPMSRGHLANVSSEHLLGLLRNLSLELRDLDVGAAVERVPISRMSPVQFLADYVQRNKPVIITGALDSWPALELWDESYLERAMGGQQVTVDVTPNGRGDAVTPVAGPATNGAVAHWFVTPHERRMTLAGFFKLLRDTRRLQQQQEEEAAAAAAAGDASGGGTARQQAEVPYVQHQNSNLSEEFGRLLRDIEPGLPWAQQVFGGPAEATNLWIGDDRSVTSFHKDHYENLYAVLRGTKVFTLLPPSDVYRMYLQRCPAARYVPLGELRRTGHGQSQEGAAPQQQQKPQPQQQQAGDDGLRYAVPLAPRTRAPAHAPPAPACSCGTPTAPAADAASSSGGGGAARSCPACPSGAFEGQQQQQLQQQLVAVLEGCDGAQAGGVVWSCVDTTLGSAAAPHPASRCCCCCDGAGCGSGAGAAPCPCPQCAERCQPLFYGRSLPAPLVAEVGPGEVLYLPALWYHQVAQRVTPGEDAVVAVNFWYDMQFDCRYAYFKLAEGLAQALGLAPPPPIGASAHALSEELERLALEEGLGL